MSDELLPLVDKTGVVLGTVSRKEAYQTGAIHMGSHGLMKNDRGEFLIQRRNTTKPSWPGCYDLSVAESVKPQESFEQALFRGMREEIGLDKQLEIKCIREKYYQEYHCQSYKVQAVISLYVFEYSGKIQADHDEVMSSQWLTASEIDTLVKTQPQNCTPWLIADWEFVVKSNLLHPLKQSF